MTGHERLRALHGGRTPRHAAYHQHRQYSMTGHQSVKDYLQHILPVTAGAVMSRALEQHYPSKHSDKDDRGKAEGITR
jgi:hypothetical protein